MKSILKLSFAFFLMAAVYSCKKKDDTKKANASISLVGTTWTRHNATESDTLYFIDKKKVSFSYLDGAAYKKAQGNYFRKNENLKVTLPIRTMAGTVNDEEMTLTDEFGASYYFQKQ